MSAPVLNSSEITIPTKELFLLIHSSIKELVNKHCVMFPGTVLDTGNTKMKDNL